MAVKSIDKLVELYNNGQKLSNSTKISTYKDSLKYIISSIPNNVPQDVRNRLIKNIELRQGIDYQIGKTEYAELQNINPHETPKLQKETKGLVKQFFEIVKENREGL